MLTDEKTPSPKIGLTCLASSVILFVQNEIKQKESLLFDKELNFSAQVFSVNVIIPCLGQLNVPRVPQFDGMDRYRGEAFHSADWKQNYDPTGRTVAVIGTGASAVQIVPTIAPKVCFCYISLTCFYRLHPKDEEGTVSVCPHRGGGTLVSGPTSLPSFWPNGPSPRQGGYLSSTRR